MRAARYFALALALCAVLSLGALADVAGVGTYAVVFALPLLALAALVVAVVLIVKAIRNRRGK